jgi:hypothetical protein
MSPTRDPEAPNPEGFAAFNEKAAKVEPAAPGWRCR